MDTADIPLKVELHFQVEEKKETSKFGSLAHTGSLSKKESRGSETK